jgi:hypothetical protein
MSLPCKPDDDTLTHPMGAVVRHSKFGPAMTGVGLGCVKTPKSNLRVEISSRFREFENQQR